MSLTVAYRHVKRAAVFSLALASLALVFLLIYGKTDSFLIINKYNSPSFDYFFRYFTFLGDGVIWVPLLVYTFLYKREFLITLLVAFAICTALTQCCKWFIFPDALRPFGMLKDQVRATPGVELHSISSFPSGHTSIAFTYALLMAFLLKRNFWTFFFPLVAFFVGYSRVYLAQHFVTDVFAGSIVGIGSALLALAVYEYMRKKKQRELPPGAGQARRHSDTA